MANLKIVTGKLAIGSRISEVQNWFDNYVNLTEGRVTQFDEKSRAWGWTWIMAVWCRLWAFLFKDGTCVWVDPKGSTSDQATQVLAYLKGAKP